MLKIALLIRNSFVFNDVSPNVFRSLRSTRFACEKEIDMARLSFRALAIGLMATGLMIPVGVALAQHSPIVVPVPQPQTPGSVTGTDPVPPPPTPSTSTSTSGSLHQEIK